MKRSILLLLSFAVTAWGCTPEKQPGVEEIIEIPTVGDLTNDSDDNIANTSFKSTITITFAASGASVAGDDAGIVKINGNQVTATNTGSDAIKYVLTGTSDNGFFKLYSGKKQALVLKDLNLTNPSGAAINNQSKKRTFVVLEGTNKLADGATYTMSGTEDQKAAFFSEAQLIFSGDGSLTVTATGKAGISSDDYIRFLGKQTVNVSSSAGHGIRGKDYIRVDDGIINVAVSADMKKGFSSDSLVRITGGTTVMKITGNAAYDEEDKDYTSSGGIKADKVFEMTGGTIFALGGLESGASLTQACYQASSWSTNKYYSITVGEDTYVFKTPSSGGTKLVVSGASKPEVKSNVTVSGGTEIFGGYGVVNGTVSGGSEVTLSSYTNSGSGPGGRW